MNDELLRRIYDNERRLRVLTLALAIGCTLLGFLLGLAVQS